MCRKTIFAILLLIPFFDVLSQSVSIGKGEEAKIIQAKDFESENFDLEAILEEMKNSIAVKNQDLDHSAATKRCLKEDSRKEQRICFSRFLASGVSKYFDDSTISTPGKYKLNIRCKIDSEGDFVFIVAEGGSPEAELSAIMALKKLKGIIPGKHNGENVDVLITFPIIGLKR